VKRPTHEDGFVEHMPYEEYAEIDALNFSTLKPMMRSPLAYKWALDNPAVETDPQKIGTVVHRMILEPNNLGELAVWGDMPDEKVRRGQVWDRFQEKNAGKTILTRSEKEFVVGCTVAVRRNPLAMKYLRQDGPTEVSMFWHDNVTGRAMKGRIDKLIPKKHTMANLKTTRSCQPYKFGAQAYSLGYYMHEAMYASGYQQLTGEMPKQKLIAFESRAPYEGAVYRIPPDVRLQGLEDFYKLLAKLAECERTDHWPAEMEEESDLILPSYAISSEDDLAELSLTEEE
jgi:hypothetical protein